MASAWFLFAHQDDEFGVFEQIHLECKAGRRVRACYFTTGVPAGGSPRQRNEESLRVLSRLGVAAADVHFVGESLGIADGQLVDALFPAADWLREQLMAGDVASVFAPAWEGGHPDHDGLCAVATAACQEAGLLTRLGHFHLYNGYRCPGPFFRVLSPLPENGPVTRSRIPWARRLRYLRECMAYDSQWSSWIGLLPFVAMHYVLDGSQAMQPASVERIGQRPHAGRLYYEKRQFATWEGLRTRVDAFRAGWCERQAREHRDGFCPGARPESPAHVADLRADQ